MSNQDDALPQAVLNLMKPFALSRDDYEKFSRKMYDTMTRGLQKNSNTLSSIKMYPTYVTNIPNGSERGKFLALDLGGTNYRVLLVNLIGERHPPSIEERTYAIPSNIMNGDARELFDYIAITLSEFLRIHDIADEELSLGFTFSFPCVQKGLTSSTLVRWTKGFSVKGVEGNNVAELLQDAINRTGSRVKCVAVVNDTVGTLASCALEDSRCAIGLIIGTGTNAAYIERRERVELCVEGNHEPHMVINTEWGAFGEANEFEDFRTQFDKEVDAESLHPGKQLFEKMVSGMYLGEIVRHVLVHLVRQNLLFHGQMPDSLLKKDSFLTKYMTEVERDPDHLYYNTTFVLTEDLKVPVVEPIDSKIVRYVCKLISVRAAYLIGAGIASLLWRMKRSEVSIGIDGSLYKFHPRFSTRMTDMIDQLKPQNTMFRLRLSEDGSGKGAAAIAAAATRT